MSILCHGRKAHLRYNDVNLHKRKLVLHACLIQNFNNYISSTQAMPERRIDQTIFDFSSMGMGQCQHSRTNVQSMFEVHRYVSSISCEKYQDLKDEIYIHNSFSVNIIV